MVKQQVLLAFHGDDPLNLENSSESLLNKRNCLEYELSVKNLKNPDSDSKDKKSKSTHTLAILKDNESSEGRYSVKQKTKNYALMLLNEKTNEIEIVKVPHYFNMVKKQPEEDPMEDSETNKILKMDSMDYIQRREMLVKEIGTNKSKRFFDKMKSKTIQVHFI